MKKPRPFSHKPIYIDSRQERLAAIEQRARQELGLEQPEAGYAEKLRGAFSSKRHIDRRPPKVFRLSTPVMVMLIVILMMIWRLLL